MDVLNTRLGSAIPGSRCCEAGAPALHSPIGSSEPGYVFDSLLPRASKVRRINKDTHDTFTIELSPPEGATGFSFLPGQFNMLYRFGVGEVPISISGDPADEARIVHTIRAAGTVTKSMRRIVRGDSIGVRGPFGTSWPVEAAKGHDVVILAGGIGLAPLRPAIYHVLRNRENFGRVVIMYGTRTPADVLYAKELEEWRGRFDISLHVTVDRADRSWKGHTGVVTSLFSLVEFDHDETIAMLCGPEIMMRFGVRDLQHRGIKSDRIYVSMERNMKCAVGFCGHCQYGPEFICKGGPVFRFDRIERLFNIREL